jgi:hypothetical protein
VADLASSKWARSSGYVWLSCFPWASAENRDGGVQWLRACPQLNTHLGVAFRRVSHVCHICHGLLFPGSATKKQHWWRWVLVYSSETPTCSPSSTQEKRIVRANEPVSEGLLHTKLYMSRICLCASVGHEICCPPIIRACLAFLAVCAMPFA